MEGNLIYIQRANVRGSKMDFSLVYTDKSNFLVLHFCSYSAFYLLICSTCTDVTMATSMTSNPFDFPESDVLGAT